MAAVESILTLTGNEDDDDDESENVEEGIDYEHKHTQVNFCSIHGKLLALEKGGRAAKRKRDDDLDDGDMAERPRKKALKRRIGLIAASLGNIILSTRKKRV